MTSTVRQTITSADVDRIVREATDALYGTGAFEGAARLLVIEYCSLCDAIDGASDAPDFASANPDRAAGVLAATKTAAHRILTILEQTDRMAWAYARGHRTRKADTLARQARMTARVRQDATWAARGLTRCARCDGAGGWEGWPGFTCYECNGAGATAGQDGPDTH